MIEPLLSDDAFLADVEAAPRQGSLLHLWWLGQSGYLMQWGGTRILVDPYLSDSLTKKYAGTEKPHVRMTRRVVDPGRLRRISIITCSHQHTDHLDAETFRAVREGDRSEAVPWNPLIVAPRAIARLAEERWGGDVDRLLDQYETAAWGDVRIHAVAAAHDKLDVDGRGRCLYLGYVFRVGPFSVYHSGDTVVYPGMAERIAEFPIDLAILPINAKVGNMCGAEAARLGKEIGANLVVPCHYEMFEFNTADPREQFVPECERLGQPFKVLRAGERLTLTHGG